MPRVGFYPDVRNRGGKPWPEDFIFPSCMQAVMEYLGHSEYDYIHFMGVTGAAFFLNWKPGWHGDNPAIYYMATLEEHVKLFEYAFDSTGHALESAMLKESPDAIDESEARHRILASTT